MTNIWTDSPRRGEKKTQINKIGNKKEKITTDTAEIQKKEKIIVCQKKPLWIIVCQQIRQTRGNGQLSGDLQPSKTESRRNRSTKQTDH